MKAIQTKITGPTKTKPRCAVAKAEGVPTMPIPVSIYPSLEAAHHGAAVNLAAFYGWLTPQHPRLIGGSLPDGTMAWVFAPAEEK